MAKQKVIILFPDAWLAYSPTLINLSKVLVQNNMEVEIVAFKQIHPVKNIFPPEVKVTLLPLSSKVGLLNTIFKGAVKTKQLIYKTFFKKELNDNQFGFVFTARKMMRFKEVLKKRSENTKVIAVDNIAAAAATAVSENVDLLSLEVVKDKYFEEIQWNRIDTLIIQSQERADFFEGKLKDAKTFFIQNSPNFVESIPEKKWSNSILYFGTLFSEITRLIGFLRLAKEYRLVLKIKNIDESDKLLEPYADLIEEGRLVIDRSYIQDEEIINYMSNFDVGLLFYSSKQKLDFNFQSSPAGKLFNYYNAGVPVVADKLIGFRSIEDFEAGMLFEDLNETTLLEAIEKIKSKQEFYITNARNAAKEFDFKTMAIPYIDYITSENSVDALS